MSNVLFTHSYFYKLDPKQWKFKQPYPPLGTLLAASVIRSSGFDITLFDVGLKDNPEEIKPILEKEKPDYLIIYDDGFNYLTKMCLTVMREASFTMAEEGKRNGCTVIISSSDASDHYEKYFSHGVDYVIRGEGEETLKELLQTNEQKKDPSTIQGIAFISNGTIKVTPPRAVIRDLDSLPLPAWDLIDMEAYRQLWLKHHGYFSLNLATTRGCPFKCNWCAKPIYGNRYNSRSAYQVVDEIEMLLKKYKPDHFWMSDDIFGLKPGWVNNFRDEVKKRGLIFRYKIQSRVDLLLEEDTIIALAESGAKTVWVGAESGSQKILDAMDKGTTVEQIREARLLLKQKGIKAAFFLQFGYPGETKEDINSTLQMVLDLMPDEIGISVSYPLPGTKFYENVKAGLHEKQNWSDSDDLAMMFAGTYSSAYYKILHRYIHNRFRIQRGINQVKDWIKQPRIPIALDFKRIASMVFHLPFALVNAFQLNQLSKANGTTESIVSSGNSVNRAFSKQSFIYDSDDKINQVLQDIRQQVYRHVSVFMKESSEVLELNSGTGIDALHFVQEGHRVHATDLSDGMIAQIQKKILDHRLQDRLTYQQLSYDQLQRLTGQKFDYIFSNFGGLNCIDDLSKVTMNLPSILIPGGFVTWVIMPPICLWELFWVFKGHGKQAFRRLHKNGVMAHLEGEYFKTYYYSLSQIKEALGTQFKFIKSEGLCALSPPPSRGDFPAKYPRLYPSLRKLDQSVRHYYPFNRWADHIIVTFQLKP